jgi:SpoVK/Ycf46/Vps4 family AAA+-type ATPase
LRKDILLIDYELPGAKEIEEILDSHLALLNKKSIEISLTPEEKKRAITALKGFTAAEIKYSLNKISWRKKEINAEILTALQDEKRQLAKKEGVLEYVKSSNSIKDVGGLENLKEWLVKREKLFSPEAAKAGIRPPRGLLMMGISGCGKSLSVKAISALWKLPLFRLDMNKVYSGMYGTPEGTFHRAIKSIEAVAPAILWIDEIEGGISSNTAKDGSTGSHIFSAFLTWMQEKSSDVFVAATANRIDLLPAEIIRKGRFDQVFFIDLPNDDEREEIFKVHLSRRGNNIEEFDLSLLSVATEFWNGAEIEHVVESAMVEAFQRNEKMNQDDLYTIIRGTVPLSRTMAEQIKFIKNWASERAVSASKKQEE